MSEDKTYTPELLPRQGELNAWMLAAAASLGLYFLSLRSPVPYWAWFLLGLFLVSALSISLGNWMDRKTYIRLSENGVAYENGLRKASMTWAQISQVRTMPARWGTSVQVIGEQNRFAFTTLGEMRFQGQVRSKTGFDFGQEIMDEIIRMAGLSTTRRDGAFTSFTRS